MQIFFETSNFSKKNNFFGPPIFIFENTTNFLTYSELKGPGLSPEEKVIKMGVGALCHLSF